MGDYVPILGGWEWLLLFGVGSIVILIVLIATVIALRVRRSRQSTRQSPAQLASEPPKALETRLAEIDRLLDAGQIDQDEHAAMRARILDLQ